MTPHETTMMFLALGVMLAAALALGEVARLLRQPAVLGEILAGVLLGPTLLGRFAPGWTSQLFPQQGTVAVALQGMTTLAVTLFLLVAGMELDLSTIWRQGRTAITVGLAGIIIPFGFGFLAAWVAPALMGQEPGGNRLIFSLFMATALAISALPVIARTLLDLNLYRSDLGMIIIAAAIFNDLFGWIIFAVILSLMDNPARPSLGLGWVVALTVGFAAAMLTVGRWIIHRLLPWIQAYCSWPGGVLGFALVLALLGAAFTEWAGVHAIFGSFLVGVAIGDSPHLREQTRTTLRQFISFIFAPLFFASIGLRVDFISHFDLRLTLLVLAIACAGKILGCGLGALQSGMERREAWAVGFGLNARGAMEIVLGLLALQYGLIGAPLFVALVIMALVTSMMSGPIMARLLRGRKSRRLADALTARTFLNHLNSATRRGAIRELAHAAAVASGVSPEAVDEAVWAREELLSTGLDKGVAVPHARLEGVVAPVVALGFSEDGIDFDSPDGAPARIIFLILTPLQDGGAQLELLADIARTFRDPAINHKVLQVHSYVQFLALMKTEVGGGVSSCFLVLVARNRNRNLKT